MVRGFFILSILGMLDPLSAKDCGAHGVIYPIEEEDLLVLIQKKLKILQETGDLERHNKELERKAKAAVERPTPGPGLTRTIESRVFHYDPTYDVKEDLRDHLGHIIHKKGTRINPLETVSLSQNLLFFDGDDLDQKTWAIEKVKETPSKLILTKGAPLALAEELKIPVYFDQGSTLTQKLGIHHVPAIVTQESLQLRIEEIKLGEKL